MLATRWIVLVGMTALAATVVAQNCPLPPVLQPVQPGIDIFSDEQEGDLGDAMAEQVAPHIRVIENSALTNYLRDLGNRLVQHLPPTKLNFRFYLIDLPEPNAFSIAGERVYMSRKVIAMAKSEDELAGVLAHELGHIVTHQTGIYMTRRFRDVLGVTQVADRADVFEKFHLYLENSRRKPPRDGSESKEQGVADLVGLSTVYRSGYQPQAFVDILDRLQETHGQTGSWLTDLFGVTNPEQRRLREAVKGVAGLPPGCADARPLTSGEAFAKWQQQIIAYTDNGGEELLSGLIFKNKLALPLRPDITNFRFSPDGKYLVAHDEGGIHVLAREPLAELFYVAAPEAHNAEFTPDSQEINVYMRTMRVETWSLTTQSMTAVHEILMREPCVQSALSYDGKTLACLNAEGDLVLLDVASNTPFLTKKQFWIPSFAEILNLMMRAILKSTEEDTEFIKMGFSPDDHYFLAGHREYHVVYDLRERRETSLPGSIKNQIANGFAFLGGDRIAVIDLNSPDKSPVLQFSSGERVDQVRLAPGLTLRGATRGNYLFVGPLMENPLGLFDIAAKRITISFLHNAADVYEGVMVSERRDGEVALYTVGREDPTATIKLPEARLGKLRAQAVSPDLEWLAISTRTRGALWNVARNIRVQYVRGFQGAWSSPNDVFYADFPKYEAASRSIVTLSTAGEVRLNYKIDDVIARQDGAFLVVQMPKGKSARQDVDIEVRDIASNKPVWSRHFTHEVPAFSLNQDAHTMLLAWSLAEAGAQEELQRFPDVKNQASREDYLFELLDLASGEPKGKVLVKTNKRSLRVESSISGGDWVAVSAEGNQILTFSLANGAERARYFGSCPRLAGKGLLALERDAREVDLYDLNSQQLLRKYVFADPVVLKHLSEDGTRLLVVTASQTVYLLDTSVRQ